MRTWATLCREAPIRAQDVVHLDDVRVARGHDAHLRPGGAARRHGPRDCGPQCLARPSPGEEPGQQRIAGADRVDQVVDVRLGVGRAVGIDVDGAVGAETHEHGAEGRQRAAHEPFELGEIRLDERNARARGLAQRDPVRVAVDADGIALREAAGARVALLKPNLTELEGLVGRSLPTLGAAIEAAQGLVDGGIGGVLVSLGPDGAVYVDGDGATHAEAHIDDLVNTVGAGDALLAGFLAAGAGRDGLRTAVAWSVAACRSPGTQMRVVSPRDAEVVEVHDVLSADRRLAA